MANDNRVAASNSTDYGVQQDTAPRDGGGDEVIWSDRELVDIRLAWDECQRLFGELKECVDDAVKEKRV